MHKLPQTKWFVRKQKFNHTINAIKKPFMILKSWIKKQIKKIRSKWG